ncbi:MAG: toprim domain-containing protein [Spongiibacteraceae bacterium]|nr:toprim domain-containing protein [Spongiibacteraceae bacterium]
MARLSDELINRLKKDISLLRLAERQGYQPKKQGKDYALCCPFHEDKTPSLIISPKNNLFNCFGCGASGSVIDWVMKTERCTFRDAVTWLGDRESIPLESSTDQTPMLESPPPLSLAANAADDQALLQRVITYYHETLKHSEEAKDYLKQRGLDDPELIDVFTLGYANRSLGLTLPEKNRKAGAEVRGQLQRIGLYRDSGHEHFNGSLVIPVINQQGEITEVYGRKIFNNLRKGTPKHLYLPGPHEGVFNLSCFTNPDIILCESLIDALTFWRWDFKHVTTSYGTGGFTNELYEAFKHHEVKRALIAYDRDEAGNQTAEKVATKLQTIGVDCYRVLFPQGMDANDYALKMTPSRKSLELVIRKAEWMGRGVDPRVHARNVDSTKSELPTPLAAELVTENLPATPAPAITPSAIEASVSDNEVVMMLGNRRYRIRGLKKAMSYEQLKINLCVSENDHLHVDQLDLYNAKQRYSFSKQAAAELSVTDDTIKKDLAQVLLKLEQLQDEQIQNATEPKAKTIELSSEEHQQALALLCDPNLLDRVLEDFNRAGVVGEETNKLVGYLAAVSRKLDKPLAVIIQSTSAAGKSSLMNAVLDMMPEEERIQYSAMTGQSLFYMGETNLKHKILAIAEEEGAEQASYALKLLQSEGELTIASTGKDADGNLTTQEYRVEGPVMLFSTTTAIDIDEELMNRCVVLTVNESREQTRLIHTLQRERETLKGLLAKEDKKHILTLHRNAQRLLKSLNIVNPYAPQLTFMDNQTRSRRDHMKYLQLIKTITLLHQYQRSIKTVQHGGQVLEYIEVTVSDIKTANRLACDVLGRSLDELPPQTRKLLNLIYDRVQTHCKTQQLDQRDYLFSRKTVREQTGWGNTQLKLHLHRLVEMEYLLIHRKGQQFYYELMINNNNEGKALMMNLISPKRLHYDEKRSGLNDQQSGCGRPLVGGQSGAGRGKKNKENTMNTVLNNETTPLTEKTQSSHKNTDASYRSVNPSPLAAELAAQPTETH